MTSITCFIRAADMKIAAEWKKICSVVLERQILGKVEKMRSYSLEIYLWKLSVHGGRVCVFLKARHS